MAIAVVEIELKDVSITEVRAQPDWFDHEGRLVVDEAEIERFPEDDSFFVFRLVELRDE